MKCNISLVSFGFLLTILSAITWGSNGTFVVLLAEAGLAALDIAILAPAINCLFFFCLLICSNRPSFLVGRREMLFLAADGMLACLLNFAFVNSLMYFPVGIVSTLCYCNIFVIMVLSRIFFQYRITWRKVSAGLLALFGVALVIGAFSQDFNLDLTGLFWILCAILSWSGMVTIERGLLMRGVAGPAVLMYNGFFAVLLFCIFSPPIGLPSHVAQAAAQGGGGFWLMLAAFGMVPHILSYYLYIVGLRYIEPSYMQIAFSLDPVTASILGYLVFGQMLQPGQIAGILLIITVVGYIQLAEVRERSAAAGGPKRTG